MNLIANNSLTENKTDSRLQSLYIRNTDKPSVTNNLFVQNIKPKTVINQDILKVTTATGEIPANNTFDFQAKSTLKEEQNKKKTEQVYNTINTTKTIISITGNIAKITNNDGLSEFLDSSDGALSASKGIVELKNSASEENTSKVVMSSISQVAGGVGSVLTAVDIPEAEFLMLTGKLVGLGAEQQTLTEKIKKRDARGIAGSSVSIAKGLWGTVLSGANAAKLGANIGLKMGKVSLTTVGKVSMSAEKITKVADKIALPFAIAGTGLTLWDWKKLSDKAEDKNLELIKTTEERIDNSSKSKILKRSMESDKEKEIKKQVGILNTNSKIMGLSFGLSTISTTALIVSVAFPLTAPITGPIALSGSIASSVIGTLADDKTRDSLKDVYEKVKTKYDSLLFNLENLIPKRQITV